MKPYKAYHIRFLDHMSGNPDEHLKPGVCDVFGVLWKEDKDSYYIVSWIIDDCIDDSVNNDAYCILKSTVKFMKELRPVKK